MHLEKKQMKHTKKTFLNPSKDTYQKEKKKKATMAIAKLFMLHKNAEKNNNKNKQTKKKQ